MNIDLLDIKKCRYIVVVAEELSFSKAAERLNMAQPPLSQQVKNIESRLGLQIFERSTRSVNLTMEGKKIVTIVKGLLESHQAIAETLKNIENRPLALGAIPLAFDAFLSERMAYLHKENSDIVINLQEGNTKELLTACDKDLLDAAVVRLHEHDLPRHQVYKLKQEDYVAVYPKSWNVDLAKQTVCLSEFNDKPYISYPRKIQPELFDKIASEFEKVKSEPCSTQQVKSKAVTMSLVANNLGFAIVPFSIVKRFKDDVDFAFIEQSLPSVDYYLYCKKFDSNEKMKRLMALLKSTEI